MQSHNNNSSGCSHTIIIHQGAATQSYCMKQGLSHRAQSQRSVSYKAHKATSLKLESHSVSHSHH